MNSAMQSAPLADRFDHLVNVISSPRFLRMEGLGNEVPFFVAPFRASETSEVEKVRGQLIKKLKHKGVRVLDVNLYDLVRELLQAEGDWKYWLEHEQEVGKSELLEALQALTDPEKHVTPAIARKMESSEFEVMFISGVGEVFPYIRSHTILNNLQKVAKSKPTLMFFPGEYSHSLEEGASLDLFGRLHDDKYYRAFNIFDREI